MLDAQVKAGSRVAVRASQQDLRGWLGERNWFRLPGDETVSLSEGDMVLKTVSEKGDSQRFVFHCHNEGSAQ